MSGLFLRIFFIVLIAFRLIANTMFAIMNLGIMPKVLPHVGVCMAVRFLRRVYSSDYIDYSLI